MAIDPAVCPQGDGEEKHSVASVNRTIVGQPAQTSSTIMLHRDRRQAGSSFSLEPDIIS
jgi:hypothetical protein